MGFDAIVVGGGHAGTEAAAVLARMGCATALVTLDATAVGRLSCNPAIGGLAKGHLVRELDALGGLMARATDAACVQFRHLNTRKGLAVRSSRAQVDVDLYPQVVQELLGTVPELTIVEGEVAGLTVVGGAIAGVSLTDGSRLTAPRVILTTGTFLAAVMHLGGERVEGGRRGERSAHALAAQLRALGLGTQRLKTGTVPRVHRDSIAWDRVTPQTDTVPGGHFSHVPVPRRRGELPCHLVHTHPGMHDLIRAHLHESPLHTGAITGAGPRYCPSIEDKVTRFPDRERHLLFLEREGHDTPRVYVAGLSTSLPRAVQDDLVHALPGLEDARILQHGYAVEYDVADPRDLDAGLQHREIPGLWLAGQVNGTSGYEEAAVQGFVAGVSAARGEPFVLARHEAYIGVLVDDLTTRGPGGEPYRMFPSRAEHRLLLREDNADRRLMATGRALGLVDDATWADHEAHLEAIARGDDALDAAVRPDADTRARFDAERLPTPRRPATAREILRRPEVDWARLRRLVPHLPELPPRAAAQVDIDTTYAGYVARAARRAEAAALMQDVTLPTDVDWDALTALSSEVRERLTASRPRTLGQAGRLPGVTPAAVHAIAAWLASRAA